MQTICTGFCAAVASVGLLSFAANAQQTPDMPRGEIIDVHVDSGAVNNELAREEVVFSQIIHHADSHWLRLYFQDAHLPEGGSIRITSLLDGEVQELDQRGLDLWSMSTAYFNGDMVLLELLAAPGTEGNRIIVDRMGVELGGDIPAGLCGICGSDDREPSSENFAARLMPVGCSAAVYNTCSCMVSAGHCMMNAGSVVAQFNVPNSLPNCNLVNPPVDDQFPVTDWIDSGSNMPGSDWAVLTVGTNDQNQTPYERYGEKRPIASDPPGTGQAIDIYGYGSSNTCTLNQTQQHSQGSISSVDPTLFFHNADATQGSSGSGILHNDEIVGVVTHCPCPNIAQRADTSAFADARDEICPCEPENNTCDSLVLLPEGDHSFNNINATTDGPPEPDDCTFFGDGDIQSDVWFGHIVQCTGELTISLCDSDYNTKVAVYGECPTESGTVLACDTSSCPGSTRSIVTLPVTEGEAVRIRVGGHLGAQGEGILSINCEPDPDPIDCPADLTGDGFVGVPDLLVLIGEWGECADPDDCPADLTESGDVGVPDLLVLIGEWGECE